MGTIQKRARKDGTVTYTATVRVKREGAIVLSMSETFAREPAARLWVKKIEVEAAQPGGIERINGAPQGSHTLAEAIDQYIKTSVREMGRTKQQVLRSIKTDRIADMSCAAI